MLMRDLMPDAPVSGGRAAEWLMATNLSCLLLQRCELLDGSLNIALDICQLILYIWTRCAILGQAVQLEEAVCQPLLRSPCQA